MDNKFLVIVLPRLKLHWVSEAQRELLPEGVKQELTETQSNQAVTSHHDTTADKVHQEKYVFFLSFGSVRKGSKKDKCAGEELRRYRNDDDVRAVLKYPRLHEPFLKHNPPAPSNAPVQRLLSVVRNVFHRKRGSVPDAHFEMQLPFRANKCYT